MADEIERAGGGLIEITGSPDGVWILLRPMELA